MKKFYRVSLLIVILVFLSTYNSKDLRIISKKNNSLFNIKNIKVKNNLLIKNKEIKEKLRSLYGINIFLIKENDIKVPINKINFLDRVEVKKKYPNTIIIKVFETKPIAIFFNKKAKYIIDSSFNLISFRDNNNFNKLPSVYGEDADKNFKEFIEVLKINSFPVKKIKNFFYFQVGRWDIELLNNKVIKFPNKNIEEVIIKSINLLNRDDFKNYNIIDLRIDDKIIVE